MLFVVTDCCFVDLVLRRSVCLGFGLGGWRLVVLWCVVFVMGLVVVGLFLRVSCS